jgi:hypothetical protein
MAIGKKCAEEVQLLLVVSTHKICFYRSDALQVYRDNDGEVLVMNCYHGLTEFQSPAVHSQHRAVKSYLEERNQ